MGSSTGASGRGESGSPKQSNNSSPPQDASDARPDDAAKPTELSSNADAAKPLAPPPRPGQQQGATGNTPDYFGQHAASGGSLSLEPNPFEQSFSSGAPETPGGTKLPSVAALTSPSSLLPGTGVTPFAWGGGSLRTGPLSPAMLSGPTNDYFGDAHHIRGGFPTPNESSLRTGLTPGGSGSMFPAPSPSTQAMFAQLAGSSATPGTIDFHRTAMNAAAVKREQHAQAQAQPQPSVTSAPQETAPAVAPVALATEAKQTSGPFDPHDNDAANGLFLLAQGRNGAQPPNQPYAVAPQQQVHAHPTGPAPGPQATSVSPVMNGGSVAGSSARGVSEAASAGSDESEPARPNTRGKGKRNSTGAATTNGRRKAEEPPAKAPASKKAKTNGMMMMPDGDMMDDDMSDDDDKNEDGKPKSKMTDEEKRKNFLERNRVAALKCRQRKKQWLANLQQKVETYSTENDHLLSQISQLREEVVNLKTLLLAHKDCPVTQQQGLHGAFMQQAAMEPFNPQMNPYGMAAPMANQAVMAGQPVNRRFS
ncbi:hypothetical protein GQ53DRAFT_787955 [Thozetella sp. PMI_491]|nr:hypothetical protein GQ53DRAFT_787955 [Thozetella sp. PMI_491]